MCSIWAHNFNVYRKDWSLFNKICGKHVTWRKICTANHQRFYTVFTPFTVFTVFTPFTVLNNTDLLELVLAHGARHLEITLDLLPYFLEAVHNGYTGYGVNPGKHLFTALWITVNIFHLASFYSYCIWNWFFIK